MSRHMITFFAFLILTLLWGCSGEDCPTCPTEPVIKPYKGWLYYVELNPQLYDVYVVDMETDSIVDSIDVPDLATGFLDVSPDGKYLAVTSSPIDDIGVHCYLYDAQTRQFIRELPDRMVPFFDLTNNLVVGKVPVENGEYGGLRVLSYPSFSFVYEDKTLADYSPLLIDPPRHRIYVSKEGQQLYSYDYINRKLTYHPVFDAIYGVKVSVFQFCLNSKGTTVFLKAGVAGEWGKYEMIAAYDLASGQLLWYKRIRGPWGGIAISPDDREIYADEVGDLHGINPGVLYVLDAATGAQLHAYSLNGYSPDNPYRFVAADEFIFSPTGDKLYAGGGTLGQGGGMVALFDPKERELKKFITPDFHRAIGFMAIGPKR